MKRVLIQIPLCLGVLLFYPFTIGLSAMAFRPSTWRDMTMSGVFGVAWILAAAFGITALLCSVVIPPDDLVRWRWLRRTVMIGLVIGCLFSVGTVASWFFSPDQPSFDSEFVSLVGIVFVLPIVVAIWNLAAIIKQPNQ